MFTSKPVLEPCVDTLGSASGDDDDGISVFAAEDRFMLVSSRTESSTSFKPFSALSISAVNGSEERCWVTAEETREEKAAAQDGPIAGEFEHKAIVRVPGVPNNTQTTRLRLFYRLEGQKTERP